jgi:hypothetical protein
MNMMISLTINRKFKLDLWSKIADELNKMGYCVGTGTNGRDRCKTKFNNLQNWFMKAGKELVLVNSKSLFIMMS